MGFFGNKRNIRRAKEAAGQQQAAGIRAMEIADTERERTIASEQTKFSVLGMLGTPGSYGPLEGGGGGGGGSGGGGGIFSTDSYADQSLAMFGDHAKIGTMGMMHGDEAWDAANANAPDGQFLRGGKTRQEILQQGAREGILDPEGYTNQLSKSPLFRMQSQQVAEAGQLMNREGPLWDRLENSVLGSIHEGAALQLRDTMRQLKNNYAKGGSARRTAANEFNVINAQERAMRTRTQETWKANLKLHDYVNQNFERVRNGSMQFTDALPLLNDNYRSAMLATANLSAQATNAAASISGSAYSLRMSEQKVDMFKMFAEGTMSLLGGSVSSMGGSVSSGAFGPAAAPAGGGGGGGGGLGGIAGIAAMFCWAAAEYFGWDTPDWFAARHWILDIWEGRFADWFRKFYTKHGKKLAWVIRHCPPVKWALRPFFSHAAREGRK